MILLIVDTQNLIMNNDLYEFETFVYRIKTLIKEARVILKSCGWASLK